MTRTGSTQRDNIKSFLQQGYSLTALEALSLFGAYRLAAHIEVLRKRGMNIETNMHKDVTGRTYARYSLPVPSKTEMVAHRFNNGKWVPINTQSEIHYAH